MTRFRPAEEAMINRAKFTEGEKARVRGNVAADVAAAFKGQTRATHATGIDAQSGKSKLMLAADAAAQGKSSGIGQALAIAGGEEDANAKAVNIAGIGRGIARGATADMAQGARRATSLALAASEARFQHKLALTDAVASVAGAGFAKYQEHRKKKKEEDERNKGFAKFGSDLTIDLPEIRQELPDLTRGKVIIEDLPGGS